MTIADMMTLSRFFFAAGILIFLNLDGGWPKSAAVACFVLASLTDFWDGRVARMRNEVTAWGKLMDPIADKVLVFSVFIAFVGIGVMPAWMLVAMLSREILITGVRLYAASQARVIAATRSGKHKTFTQMFAAILVLFYLAVREAEFWTPQAEAISLQIIHWSLMAAVILTLYSGFKFFVNNRSIFK
ncbi:MAG: CDP-diacylglycerol--glycerol-3-phosphate 3-phosphatidyltransferase [Candidatus Omnitrophica bacterium]|nr:CDP-diacylglycerol--glycerol-3-phosphate 3-phosphatidyltransferase [Candidatus Omnitrophota bacterium]